MTKYKNINKYKKIKRNYYKRQSNFKKGLLISWLVFVGVMLATLVVLWFFLNSYEKNSPEYVLRRVVKQIEDKDYNSINLTDEEGTSINSGAILADKQYISEYFKNCEKQNGFGFAKLSSQSNEQNSFYVVKSGDDKLLKVALIHPESKKDIFGFFPWKEEQSILTTKNLEVQKFKIQVPENSTVYINLVEVNKDFATSKGEVVDVLKRIADRGLISNPLKIDSYEVKGIFSQPNITVKDPNENMLTCEKKKDVYMALPMTSEEFINAVKPRVLETIEPYALYFTGDSSRGALSNIMLTDSPAYESAIGTDVSWMASHSRVDINDKEAKNFVKYSDECFSCDVTFSQAIYQWNDEPTKTWNTNMTWVFVKRGEQYYIADFITNIE